MVKRPTKYQDKRPRRRVFITKPKTDLTDVEDAFDLPIEPNPVSAEELPESSPCPRYTLPDECLTSPSSTEFMPEEVYPANDMEHFADFSNSDLSPWDDQSNLLLSVDEHRLLTHEERSELYHLIDRSIPPATGIQESAGSYMRHMKERFGLYHEHLQFTMQKGRREPDNRALLARGQKRASLQLNLVAKPLTSFGVSEPLIDTVEFDKWVSGCNTDMETIPSIERPHEQIPTQTCSFESLSGDSSNSVKRVKGWNELVRKNSQAFEWLIIDRLLSHVLRI